MCTPRYQDSALSSNIVQQCLTKHTHIQHNNKTEELPNFLVRKRTIATTCLDVVIPYIFSSRVCSMRRSCRSISKKESKSILLSSNIRNNKLSKPHRENQIPNFARQGSASLPETELRSNLWGLFIF